MIDITVDKRIVEACPQMKLGLVRASVKNEPTSDELWGEMQKEADIVKSSYQLLEVNKRPAIAATRHLYKTLGKDPSRYRVASEQLCRRVLKGLGLYRLTSLIDITNLVSMTSGYPISGLDADKIVGNELHLGVGEHDEPYCGIGRGPLNIEGMPVYRDAQGGIATPTSDEERTKFTLETHTCQININAFGPEMDIERAVDWTVELLQKYASATNVETKIIDQF